MTQTEHTALRPYHNWHLIVCSAAGDMQRHKHEARVCHVTAGAAAQFLMGIGTGTKADSYRKTSFHARLGIAMRGAGLVKSAGGKIYRLTLMDTWTQRRKHAHKKVCPLCIDVKVAWYLCSCLAYQISVKFT